MKSLEPRLPSRRSRRALAVTAVSASLLVTATFWLATTGTTGLTITPAPGLADDGEVAAVTPMTSSVSQSNGAANLQVGRTVAKADVAKDFTDKIRITASWTNAIDAAKVLLNPNAQIRIGVYYPVSTTSGSCTTGKLAIVDGGTTFCGKLDAATTGSASVGDGELFVAKDLVSGYLAPSVSASSTSACAADTAGATTWCQPAGLAADKRRLYILSSILTPGGIPKGQQSNPGNGLQFFVRIRPQDA